MEHQRTPKQPLRGARIIERQAMHGRADQGLAFTFRPLRQLKLGPAPAAGPGTIEASAAQRTAIHRSRFQVEQQVLQLLAPVLQGRAVAVTAGIPDRLDQVDDLQAILLARVV